MNHTIKRQNNIPITLNRIPNRRAVLQQRSCQGKDANANRRRQDCRLRAPHEVEPDVTHELKQTRSPRPRPEPWSRPFRAPSPVSSWQEQPPTRRRHPARHTRS
jgi:hypothetical protein